MGVWDVLLTVLTFAVDLMQEFDILFGISVWDIMMLLIILGDLGMIIGAIFKDRSGGGAKNG